MRSGPGRTQWTELQAAAVLDQVGPVNGTYYQIFQAANCKLINFVIQVDTVGENLQARLTVDGEVFESVATACVAGIHEFVFLQEHITAPGAILVIDNATPQANLRPFMIEGKLITCEVRKTTANGGGNLKGTCMYGVRSVG